MGRKHNKHLDFEVNLIPFIDLLSVCICFLLLTAVWVQIGAMNVKQAVGGQPAADTQKKPVMWVHMNDKGDLSLDVQESARVAAAFRKTQINAIEGHPDFERLAEIVGKIKETEPALVTALIQPQAASIYEDIVRVMDQVKKAGLIDLGVAPL